MIPRCQAQGVGFRPPRRACSTPVSQGTTVPDVAVDSPQAGGCDLWLRWVFPESDGRATRLFPGVTRLGRDLDGAACLPSAQVSRRHAEIWWAGAVPMIRDLDSTNGVFLNEQRVRQAPLRVRDVVRVGDWIGIVTALPIGDQAIWSFEEVIAHYWAGPALRARLAPARQAAASDLPIVIQGETGAGKEGAARSIHLWSGRQGPFAALNCAALPEALAEGELFGYRKGAFTGADRASPGHLRAAAGGTLFLDEIADLSLATQAKLLRAIEQREVVPLGESRPVSVDVRLVAATQIPLRRAVDENRFRGDLYARLDGFTLEIPPLRERIEEVPFLFQRFLGVHGRAGAPTPRLDPLLVERLCTYDWPFNVRELALLVRRLVSLHGEAPGLDRGMLPERLRAAPAAAPAPGAPAVGGLPGSHDRPAVDAAEPGGEPGVEEFLAVLRTHQGNVKRAAEALRISRGRAYRLMEQVDALDLEGLRAGR
jgi:transcriptional regulator with PAS, ATPase and Fis domain